MASTFNAKKYLEGTIDQNNCNHEMVFCNKKDKNEIEEFHCFCPICNNAFYWPNQKLDNRFVYFTKQTKKEHIYFIKNILTYLSHFNMNKDSIDLTLFFAKNEKEITEILNYISVPTKEQQPKVRKKYQELINK